MMRPQTCLVLAKYMASLLSLGVLFASHAARSEPVTNRILSGYQILVEQKCALVKINFNHRIRYVSHFPIHSGIELRIMLRPIDPRQFDLDGTMREALRPPQERSLGIKAIQYEAAIAEGPTLTILFDRPMSFDAAGGADFQSLVFSVTKTGNACKPVFPSRAANGWETVISARDGSSEVAIARPPKPAAIPPVPVTPDVPAVAGTAAPVAISARPPANGPVSVSGPAEVTVAKNDPGANASDAAVATLIGEARDALRQGKFGLAITQLKKAVQLPESRRSPEARELLGVAYQKDRQSAAAKSVYEDYLRRYPNGEGSDGVRQRLQGIETADASPALNLRTPTSGPASIDGGTQPGGRIASGSYWSVSGSLSTFYIRDDTHSIMRDPTLALDLNATKDDHQIHQNTLLTSFDLAAAWGNPDLKAKFRFSGTEENRFGPEEANIAGISALFLDMAIKSWDTEFRIGRQTRNTDGVLGRFDGAVITYHVNPLFSLTALGGSPVEFRSDLPFKDDRYFYGGAVTFGPYRGFDADVYAIEQMDRSFIDRQAVGTELHYNDANKSIFATVDYDTHFNELDAAIFTGTWTFADKSVLRLGADYRKAPFLTTWNALLGQPYTTLYDLLKAASIEHWNLEQMAIDRTATYQSSTVGYSRALTDKLQINLDFTQAHIDGTITSFNVNGTPDMGDEYYYSAQLVGTGLFLPNDLYTAAFRYSDLKNSQNFAVDLSTRYPWSEALRIQPRIVAGYTEGKGGTPFDEYTLLPSLLIDYFLRKDLSFEVEVGNRWTWRTLGTTRSTEDEFLITAGFRLDFYADAQNCLTPSVFCRTSSQAAR